MVSSPLGVQMLDFTKLRQKIKRYDEEREKLIIQGRLVLRGSKELIYTIHRGDISSAKKLYAAVKKEKEALDKITTHDPKMRYEGSFSEAIQEYVEAMTYYGFVVDGKIPDIEGMDVGAEDYLMGLCDLTGELTRRAVNLATAGNYPEVEKIKGLVQEIFTEFLKFDLRNSQLRKKSDSIKYNLMKLEDIMYDIKIKGKAK